MGRLHGAVNHSIAKHLRPLVRCQSIGKPFRPQFGDCPRLKSEVGDQMEIKSSASVLGSMFAVEYKPAVSRFSTFQNRHRRR